MWSEDISEDDHAGDDRTGTNNMEMSACNITHANPGQPSRPGSTRKNPGSSHHVACPFLYGSYYPEFLFPEISLCDETPLPY